ncbi:hypothetical protein VTN77DRAFT_9002 [Rasamsonia byssochlamydoides]|uniref:uncharacterized protein n=1 Tax=Rasamsonia byssochlamydoides TaxID=89139 RepID=UPI0037432DED
MDSFDMNLGNLDLDMVMDDVDVSELLSSSFTQKSDKDDVSGLQQSGTSAGRRNWTQRILQEIRDMILVLSADGRILYASPSTRSVAEYDPSQLNGRFLSHFIHEDDKTTFIREFHESIATGHRLRFHYRFKKSDDSFVILEASGHPHIAREKVTPGTGKEGKPCNGFFLICRPYPTKSCQLLDSFLEQKVENMRLTRRIADLKKEEEEELRPQQQWLRRSDNDGNISPGDEREGFDWAPTFSADKGMMLPPAKPRVSSSGQEPFLTSLPDSSLDTMTRSDTSSIIDGIEMMTGLRYGEGERSQGLSTGDANAGLIQDDADMHLLETSPGENDKKKKKLKTSEEYVCTDCGTLASPEWRKGPSGPKTLCNACGLRWAKKEKKRQGSLQSSSLSKEV